MFGSPKPAFGQTAGTFGGFNPTNAASPFGQNAFGKPATAGFGTAAPSFGAPTTGSALFGSPAPATGGIFGQPANQSGFGFTQNTSGGGLFGANQSSNSLFGQTTPATQTFGAKPAGFGGFGATSTGPVGGLFGANNQIGTGLFGQSAAPAPQNAGLFGSPAGGFGSTGQTGTYVKFAPVSGTDVIVKNGQGQSINTQHHCITCMKEYENKSLEELRYEDYLANRKGPGQTSMFGSNAGNVGGAFGQPSTSGTLFGQTTQDKPGGIFGQPAPSAFGQSSMFGKPATTGFGAQPAASNTFAFGSNTTNQTPMFGAAKPFGNTAAPVFSTPTQGNTFRPAQQPTFSSFGTMQQQPGSIFGAKPPENNTFGMPQTSTAGSFGFGQAPAQNTGDIFGAKPATAFGAAAPVFGSTAPFGGTANPGGTAGSLFPSFGAKPAETGVPTFGNFNATSNANPGLGGGINLSGSMFGAKPQGTGLFGAPTGTGGAGLFGNAGNPQLVSNLGALGGSTLGGGLGGTFGAGGLGTGNAWGGLNMNSNLNLGGGTLGANTHPGALGGVGGAVAGAGVHDRLITLTRAYPYGYSALLKDISPNSDKVDDSLKPTNPAAQRAVLESDKYRVSTGNTRLRVKPLHAMSKKSLFDGLEEDDPSIQKLILKPNVKRLVLRPKPANVDSSSSPERVQNDAADRNAGDVLASVDPPIGSPQNPAERDDSVDAQSLSSTNIQKRIGLTSPRGSILKNSSNTPDVGTDNSNSEDAPENRRSSWLATKQFRPRPSDSDESAPLDNTVEQFLNARNPQQENAQHENERRSAANPRLYPDLSVYYEFANPTNRGDPRGLLDIEDKENIENPASNDGEESPTESQSSAPHPTGIKLTRSGYYTIPSMDALKEYVKPDGKCIVPQFTIGRRGYGNVFFDCEMDVADLDIDQLVHILNKEIIIYPNDAIKPPIGEGLNRPAQVTLDYVHPIDKTLKTPIVQPEKLAKMDYEGKLRRVCHKHGTRFIEYRPQTGSWVFKVPHFSKYGLTNSDEEDEGQADPQRKPPSQQPLKLPPQPTQRGLGGFLIGNFPTEIQSGINPLIEHNNQTMDSVAVDTPFISRLNGVTKGLAMDTSEENSMDSAALYPEAGHASFYGSKDATSPTSQLARLENRSSHTLQLMKASFFNAVDEDMDDVASVTDQMVPQLSVPRGNASIIADVPCSVSVSTLHSKPEASLYSGLSIKQPVVKPKSVVLQYHKRVLSYKNTITGRFGSECYADMAMGFARLARVGWGPSLHLTALTTADVVDDKTRGGDLLVLNSLTRGRGADDISQQLIMRLQIAGGGQPSKDDKFKNSIEKLLKISLKYSEIGNSSDESCPHISPSNRQILAAEEYLDETTRLEGVCGNVNFGVNPSYWKDVWSLCIALWGEPGEEGSDPSLPDGGRLLGRHAALSEWLQSASNSHSDEAGVFTSLASRNIYEACRLAQKLGDHFLSIMISQIGGEMRVRNLAARQLGLWRETCADRSIDSVRLIIYALLAGRSRILVSGDGPEGTSTSLHACNGLDWIRAFGLHFWYICEPVATIGDAVRSYEKSFYEESRLRKSGNERLDESDSMEEGAEEFEFDIATAETEDILYGRVAFPSPPYEINVDDNDKFDLQASKRVLDLRYQLMALKASRWHSIDSLLNPASHTPDFLDYRLSWLIQQFLEGIGYSHWSARGLFNIVTGFAAQLEAHGMWIWAVFVLQHVEDGDVRNHMVKNLIMRYANDNNKETSELLNKFGIPQKWVYQSMALKNKYSGNRENEARYLTLAGQFADAHKVIMDEIAPSTILNEKTNLLRKLLLPLSSAGNLGQIPQWSTGGHLLLEFLDICDEVNSLQEGDCENLAYQCEALRIRLANACAAVNMFPTPTLKHTVVRCEIGARLASIGCAIAGLGSTLNKTNIAPLLNLLHRMDLPSDYVRNLLDKVSDSLTEDPEPILYTEMSSSSEENDVEIMVN